MSVGELFSGLKNKVRGMYNNFFYEGREAARAQAQEAPYPGQEAMPPQVGQDAAWQTNYQGAQQQAWGAYQAQGYPQQGAYQGYPGYTQPQPQPQQQPYQAASVQAPAPDQRRFRRSSAHQQEQQASNVVEVNFGGYQAPQSAPAQPAPTQEPQQAPGLLSARIINAKSMGDCRSAITLLRNGDAVLIAMENITDPTDMRRLVDTLSGACYSLTATITKVSRYGVYLLAPQTLAVFADQATNQMNTSPARGQSRAYQPVYPGAQQRTAYPPQTQPQAQSVNPPYGQQQQQQQAFTQRSAVPEEAPQQFYQRPAPQEGAVPAFTTRPAGYGYAPDDASAANQ